MKFVQLYQKSENTLMESTISDSCSTFIRESEGKPVFKILPHVSLYERIKIRVKNQNNPLSSVRDAAFNFKKFDNRALEVLTHKPPKDFGLYYIFPVNGYKFAYNTKVDDMISKCESMGDVLHDHDTITEVLKYSYSIENLVNGLEHANKINFFNIPYYFAVNASLSYDELYGRLI